MRIMITGGYGFIGLNATERLLNEGHTVINVDKITPASTPHTLKLWDMTGKDYRAYHTDINDKTKIKEILFDERIDAILNFAAGSHVDNSLIHPELTIQDNVLGSLALFSQAHLYHKEKKVDGFRVIHVSTDEVYGELHDMTSLFTEETAYNPTSPYAISKAASDFFARSYYKTYGLPVVITNCTNNYGRYQFPEKLIPMIITNALLGVPITIHGNGMNVRDWIAVEDHVDAILTLLRCKDDKKVIGEKFNIGSNSERTNLQIVNQTLTYLEHKNGLNGGELVSLVKFGSDRPGNDKRYGVDSTKIRKTVGWKPKHDFEHSLHDTIDWYCENKNWWQGIANTAKVW